MLMFARYMEELIGRLDRKVIAFVANRRNPMIENISTGISGLCSPVNALIYMLISYQVDYSFFTQFLKELATVWLIVYGIKLIVSRERPKESTEIRLTASFPSAHSATAFVLAGLLTPVFGTPYLLYSLAGLVAVSRIYLQSHYLSDVTIGSLIGILLTSLI
jgi:membrane-associated phospholipid phosphatase